MIITSIRPEYRREMRQAKKHIKRMKLKGEQAEAIIMRAKVRHEERKLDR